jgi:hypothetical protein
MGRHSSSRTTTGTTRRLRRRVLAAGVGVAMVAAAGGIALATDSGSAPSVYTSIAPTVVGQYNVVAGGNRDATIVGVGGVPSSATSVQLSVTALNESATSSLYVYASGSTQPGSANMRWNAGVVTTVPITTAVGTNGQVHLHNTTGTAQIKISVIGYYAPELGSTAIGKIGFSTFLSTTAANVIAITVPAGTYSVIAKLSLQQNAATSNIEDQVSCITYDPNIDDIDEGSATLSGTHGDTEMITMTGLVSMDAGQINVSCNDSTGGGLAFELRLTAIHLSSATGSVAGT